MDNKKRLLLEQLYLEYSSAMFHVAFEVLRDHSLAEDAVHEAFLKLVKNTFKLNDIFSKQTKGFMLVVVRNMAINIFN
jgi:RNA polymerase sigma-70 factor (ECF subfamily)